MQSIVIIGPNPAIDYTLDVPHFAVGKVHRTGSAFRIAGGKPFNVARTIRRLGGHPVVVCPLGGEGARVIGGAAADLGIRLWATTIAGETRTAIIVVDSAQNAYTVINESGPELSAAEAIDYERLACAALPLGAMAVASGSLPPGLPADFYARLAVAARSAGVRIILDSSGEPLRWGLGARPWAVKVNRQEIEEVTGTRDPWQAAEVARRAGIEHVVVTMGGEGAIYWGTEGKLRLGAAPVPAVNPTAAGDAFLGTLALGLADGRSWPASLRQATAVAGLIAGQFGPDLGPDPKVESLLHRISVVPESNDGRVAGDG